MQSPCRFGCPTGAVADPVCHSARRAFDASPVSQAETGPWKLQRSVPRLASAAAEAAIDPVNKVIACRFDPMHARPDGSDTVHGGADGACQAAHPVAASSACIAATLHGRADISGHPSDTTHFAPDASDTIGGDGDARPDGTRQYRPWIDGIGTPSRPRVDVTRQYLARVRS